MDNAWNTTLVRTQDDGSLQSGFIAGMGAPAFDTTITTMQLEFPMLVIAQEMMITSVNQQGS